MRMFSRSLPFIFLGGFVLVGCGGPTSREADRPAKGNESPVAQAENPVLVEVPGMH